MRAEADKEQQEDEGSQSEGADQKQAHKSDDLHPKLNEQEQKDVEERSAASAQVVYGAIQKEGEEEIERPPSALAWSGLAAGLSMGFSLVGEGLLHAMLPDEPWRPLVAKFGYSLGFLLVILGRQQLFTENTLTPILPLMTRKDLETFVKVARLWAVVLATNLLGALIFGAVVGNTSVFNDDIKKSLTDVSLLSLQPDFWTIMLRGVFAGWLIALMVWLLPSAETARVAVIIIVTYVVGVASFSHVIAGAVEMFYLASTGAAGWGQVIGGYLVPTLIGNIVGGVALVAALNHAQVVSGSGEGEK